LFDHVTIRVSDVAASERFYALVLATIGIDDPHRGDGFVEWNDFSISRAREGDPVTRRLHVAFFAPSRAHVDEFWRAGTAAGYRDDGAPGPRPQYSPDYYGGFLLDPDGLSVEAVHHGEERGQGIDHLWVRVGDVAASTRFYETIAPYAALAVGSTAADRTQFRTPTGTSFSVVHGEPTENVHLAFTAADNESVEGFHRAAVEAGYQDNGAPGERPVYHAGYYGAFVVDPDGNNVEVVNHNR
jgi:catechol 2,3-dioxygenase-like lactoylglutathione lyase family enzyme